MINTGSDSIDVFDYLWSEIEPEYVKLLFYQPKRGSRTDLPSLPSPETMLRHDSAAEKENTVTIPPDESIDLLRNHSPPEAYAVYSEFWDGDSIKHIPMLDFSEEICRPGGVDFIEEAMREMGEIEGAILDSGRSYHYIGFHPITESRWRRFMTESLLLSPYVDAPYIAHRLLYGAASLRVTGGEHKPNPPTTIRLL